MKRQLADCYYGPTQNKFELYEHLKTDFEGKDLNFSDFTNYSGPNFNVTPTSRIPVLDSDYKLRLIHWGFHVGSMPGIVINARNEECENKRSFKDLINTKRCVVTCSGYYEWHTNSYGKKIPHSFRPRNDDEKVFYLAALYKPSADSVVLVTRDAVKHIAQIHTRMPVILDKSDVDKWLDHSNTFKDLQKELITEEFYEDAKKIGLETSALGPHVNSIKNSGPECLQSLKDYKEESFAKGIGKFFPKAKKPKTG